MRKSTDLKIHKNYFLAFDKSFHSKKSIRKSPFKFCKVSMYASLVGTWLKLIKLFEIGNLNAFFTRTNRVCMSCICSRTVDPVKYSKKEQIN